MSARVRWSLPRSCGKECQPRQSSKFRYTCFCRFWLDRSCRKERTPAENPGKAPSCAVRAFGGSGGIEVVAPQNQAPSRACGVSKVGNGGRSAQIPCLLFQKSHPSAHSQRAPVDPSKEPCLQPVVSPLPPKKKLPGKVARNHRPQYLSWVGSQTKAMRAQTCQIIAGFAQDGPLGSKPQLCICHCPSKQVRELAS